MQTAPKVLLALAFLASGAAQAADPKAVKAAEPAASFEVPGGDIFGFTSGTDVGKVGDYGLALENSGAFGARDGRYRGLSQKLELSHTFAKDWSIAGSLFGNWSSLRGGSTDDHASYGFDGASFEVRHRVIDRSATNRFAVTLAIEPRWARIDGLTGKQAPGFGAEGKLQIDAPVAEGVYWAANVNYAAARERDPLDRSWSQSSETSLSTALTYELVKDTLFMGAEARWQQAWSSALFGHLDGQALYFGPTVAWVLEENVTLNAVLLPQIAGKARSVAGPLDLDNFNRANYRVKLAIGF